MKRNNGGGYAKTLTVFVPKLKVAGASDEVLKTIWKITRGASGLQKEETTLRGFSVGVSRASRVTASSPLASTVPDVVPVIHRVVVMARQGVRTGPRRQEAAVVLR
jgi:hypothetical protein